MPGSAGPTCVIAAPQDEDAEPAGLLASPPSPNKSLPRYVLDDAVVRNSNPAQTQADALAMTNAELCARWGLEVGLGGGVVVVVVVVVDAPGARAQPIAHPLPPPPGAPRPREGPRRLHHHRHPRGHHHPQV